MHSFANLASPHVYSIGPLGYYIFNAPVPNTPATWTVTAFGMSASHGFGLQQSNIHFSSVRPFFINVEMPGLCTLGEQLGVRVSIFNNLPFEIEVVVVLARSPDYKFVHVGPLGRVSSYSPKVLYTQTLADTQTYSLERLFRAVLYIVVEKPH